jgi:hypothetical protein
MRRILQLCIALGAGLTSTASLNAQSNSRLGPGSDSNVTTGIGSNSTFKNIPPSPGQPPPDTSRSVFWYLPDAYEKPQDKAVRDKEPDKGAAPPAPAAEVPENPRTMITRDRIESPQHR